MRRYWWAVIALCAGCGRLRFDERTDGGGNGPAVDALDLDALAPACTNFGPWSPRIPLAQLNTGLAELGPHLHADDKTLYFSSGGGMQISTRPSRGSAWSAPTPITELNGMIVDDPSTTADNLEMWFDTFTPTGCAWVSKRANTSMQWGAPVRQDQLCNAREAVGTHISNDGLRIYYTVTGSWVIEASTRTDRSQQFQPGVQVTNEYTAYPTLSSDELTLYFEAGSPRDLFVATRADLLSDFDPGAQIAALASSGSDEDASISIDGLEMVFISDSTGNFELYTSSRSCL